MLKAETTVILSILDGDPISKLSSTNEISSQDLFIIARPEVHNMYYDLIDTENFLSDIIMETEVTDVSDLITEQIEHIIKRLVHLDYKVTYDQLSTQLLNDVSSRFGFKSMTYRDIYEYSMRIHSHDYTKVRCYPTYTSTDIINQYSVQPTIENPHDLDEWIGTMEIYQLSMLCVGVDIYGRGILSDCYIPMSTDIYIPHIEFPEYKDLDVGEVRFLGRNEFPNNEHGNPIEIEYNGQKILYDSENNGYWSYLNGNTFTCLKDDFINACKVYGNNGKTGYDLSFTVPLLSNFIKLNPRINVTDPMQYIPYKLSLPMHTHTIKPDIFKESVHNLSTYARFFARPDAGYQSGQHAIHTFNKKNPPPYLGKLSCAIQNSDLNANQVYTQEIGEEYEVYPTFNSIPAIVYIGRK